MNYERKASVSIGVSTVASKSVGHTIQSFNIVGILISSVWFLSRNIYIKVITAMKRKVDTTTD